MSLFGAMDSSTSQILILLSLLFPNTLATTAPSNSCEKLMLKIEPQAITVNLRQSTEFGLFVSSNSKHNLTLTWDAEEAIVIRPPAITIERLQDANFTVEVSSSQQGRFIIRPIIFASDPELIDDNGRLFVQLKVAKYRALIIISMLIGWAYTVCWTIGDYFQAWTNYRRKSVVGLSIDFLYLNVVGNCCYATFNVLLFINHHIQSEYFRRHPFGLNPVVPNDVGYAVHAVFGNVFLIAQCYIFQNDGNVVSKLVKFLISGCVLLVGVFCGLAIGQQMHWLDFLYMLSYVKLSTNLIKYIPQVFMNYQRKSTEGFAISNRLLDLAGGLLSLLQMMLNSWNYDDWQSIVGSPVKFGLGFVSIFFDVIFMLQHYTSAPMNVLCWFVLGLGVGVQGTSWSLSIVPQSVVVTFGEPVSFNIEASGLASEPFELQLFWPRDDAIQIASNQSIRATVGWNNHSVPLLIEPVKQGRFIVKPSIEPAGIVDDSRLFLLIKVAMYKPLIIISLLVGWSYTACWSAGYYPQIWLNYRRKSVVGLSFDFLYINIVGHISYVVFNVFLYWNSYVEEEYYRRHPLGLNPVIGNDIGFAVHAVFGTGLTILQCRIYDNGGNSVSKPARAIICTYLVIIVVTMVSAVFDVMHWLDFLYILSYIKLSTTMIKYFPQAYMNYRRKSTEGFEIMNRLLDIAGGLLGILQMVINAWNFDDWRSIGGDPVKFGLGIFSILFDLVFMFQHYILYRKRNPKIIVEFPMLPKTN
uniref:Cystinosin homolog n=1 Tax=Anopheles dirus TaxID=7168 RepID=A0A182NS31_9DIPT